MLWGSLLHLSFNMWEDYYLPTLKYDSGYRSAFALSESLWNDALKTMQQQGLNMVVIDLGNAIQYDSQPEIAVKKEWSTALKAYEDLGKKRDDICKGIDQLGTARKWFLQG